MDGEAVKELSARFRGPVELGGFLFRPNDWTVADPSALVQSGPLPKALAVSTLGAVRDYVTENKDALELAKVVVYVSSPNTVWVMGPLSERARVRETYLTASAVDTTDGFLGRFMALDEFLIGLQVRFIDADDRKRLLALLSNVKSETVKTALDDGITQVVQARAGVALVSDVAVPNPVTLTAYRTFRDIVHPSSIYVLRVNSGKTGGLPEVGLFEADGGSWRLTATARVKDWLSEALPTISVLA